MGRIIAILLTLTLAFAGSGCTTVPSASSSADAARLVDPYKPVFADTARSRTLLIGAWHGATKTKDGRSRYWLVERHEDGSFRIQFRTIEPDGAVNDNIEVGDWGVSGPIYFSITRGWLYGDLLNDADPTNPNLYDAYHIVSLDSDSFTYRSVETDTVFTVQRVTGRFELPTR